MKILGIETSCDDTCISFIESENNAPHFKVISSIVSSQDKVHEKWGGVYPTLARREHQKNLIPVFKKAIAKAKFLKKSSSKEECFEKFLKRESLLSEKLPDYLKKISRPDIDAIAVTVGPGLDPSLWTGINFAKTIACYWQVPIIPINHIEAHLIISLFSLKDNLLVLQEDVFPAIGLIVSGGHTQIVLIEKIGKYRLIGETRDDAAGECFDKTARIIGLGYPGGPSIAKEAKKDSSLKIQLPRPMIQTKDCDFSFSGLKTAALYHHRSLPLKTRKSKKYQSAMAYEIQQAIVDVLFKKTALAIKQNNCKSLIIGGGVSANKELQKRIASLKGEIKILMPPKKTQMDNALMISVTGFFKKAAPLEKIKANPNLNI